MKRKRLSKILIAFSVAIVALIPVVTYVQAAGFHSYKLVDYKDDVATLNCILCDECITARFSDQYNLKKSDLGYISGFDVVKDNVINAKDYAKLNNTYYSSDQSTTKPTASQTTSKTTTEKSTDKDGWDNEILKP